MLVHQHVKVQRLHWLSSGEHTALLSHQPPAVLCFLWGDASLTIETLWYPMGFPRSFFISTLTVRPGTRADRRLVVQTLIQHLSVEQRLIEHSYDLISPPDEISCVGLRALPACADALTSSQETQAGFRALQLNKNNVTHLHYFNTGGDVIFVLRKSL